MGKRKIIDVHAHVGVSSALRVGSTPEEMIALMEKNAIDMAVISPIPGFEDPDGIQDVVKQNNNVAELMKRYPERFPAGLGVIEPRHGKRSLEEVDRVFSELKLNGIMFHNDYMGIPLNDENVFAIVERASKYKDQNIVIMAHIYHFSPLESPNRLAVLAESFPDLTFIAAHPAMDVIEIEHSIYVAKKCPNIYLDTCLMHHHLGPVERMVRELGAERIMFGSDLPYYSTCIDKIIVETSNITEEEKDQIFFKTASKIFNLGCA